VASSHFATSNRLKHRRLFASGAVQAVWQEQRCGFIIGLLGMLFHRVRDPRWSMTKPRENTTGLTVKLMKRTTVGSLASRCSSSSLVCSYVLYKGIIYLVIDLVLLAIGGYNYNKASNAPPMQVGTGASIQVANTTAVSPETQYQQ
jgi:hypothetical protein